MRQEIRAIRSRFGYRKIVPAIVARRESTRARHVRLDSIESEEIGGERKIIQRADPTDLYRARRLGFKRKNGVIIVQGAIRKGRARIPNKMGVSRRPKRAGVNRIYRASPLRLIWERRVQRHYPNMMVWNSYLATETGDMKIFEAILIDPVLVRDDKTYRERILTKGALTKIYRE